MRAIASRIESVAFSGNTGQAELREASNPGVQAWQVPTGAIERRVFEISTSGVNLQSGTSQTAQAFRPILEVWVGQSVATVFQGTKVASLPLGVRVPVSFSLDPGMAVGVKCVSMPTAPAAGIVLLGCVLTYERQA